MAKPDPTQHLIDRLSALALIGAIDLHKARRCIEEKDWDGARRLILREATGRQATRSRHGSSCSRAVRSRRHPSAKLTEADVAEIHRLYRRYPWITMVQLARCYGVSHAAISYVITRKTWRHVP